MNSLWKISSFTNNLEWDLSYFSFFRVALLSIVNAIIDCDPHQAEECHQTYERKCQRLYKNDCFQDNKEVEEDYESQDCSDVEICDMDFNCYPLTECFTVTKTRTVNRPITKCNKVPYNDCRSVPKNVCENVWKSNCTEVSIFLLYLQFSWCFFKSILMYLLTYSKIIELPSFFVHFVDGNSAGPYKSYA